MRITNVSWRDDRWWVLIETDETDEDMEVEVWREDDELLAEVSVSSWQIPAAEAVEHAEEFVREHGDGFGEV